MYTVRDCRPGYISTVVPVTMAIISLSAEEFHLDVTMAIISLSAEEFHLYQIKSLVILSAFVSSMHLHN